MSVSFDDGMLEVDDMADDFMVDDFEDEYEDGEHAYSFESAETDDFDDFEIEFESDDEDAERSRRRTRRSRGIDGGQPPDRLRVALRRIAQIAGEVVGGSSDTQGLREDEDFLSFEQDDDEDDEMAAGEIPLRPADDVFSEQLAAEAARTSNASKAKSLAGGVTTLVLTTSPLQVKKVTPVIIERAANLVALLRKSKATAPLVKTLPSITKKTAATLAKKAKKGKPVTAKTAKRVMKKHVVKTLKDPAKVSDTLRKNLAKRRKLKKAAVQRAEHFL